MTDPVRLNLGCGIKFVSGFINIDPHIDPEAMMEGINTKEGPYAHAVWEEEAEFVQASMTALPFPDDYADYAEAVESLEHLGFADLTPALVEIRRVLKVGGEFVACVPSFSGIARLWLEMEKDEANLEGFSLPQFVNVAAMVYGNQAHEGEFHRVPFSPRFLKFMLETAGFRDVRIKMYPFGSAAPDLLTMPPEQLAPPGMVALMRGDTLLARARK